jgi:hypothetical protein
MRPDNLKADVDERKPVRKGSRKNISSHPRLSSLI